MDDLLHGSGGYEFEEKVMKLLKQKFVFGSEEETVFRYVGLEIDKKGVIVINQDHYLESLTVPQIGEYNKNISSGTLVRVGMTDEKQYNNISNKL